MALTRIILNYSIRHFSLWSGAVKTGFGILSSIWRRSCRRLNLTKSFLCLVFEDRYHLLYVLSCKLKTQKTPGDLRFWAPFFNICLDGSFRSKSRFSIVRVVCGRIPLLSEEINIFSFKLLFGRSLIVNRSIIHFCFHWKGEADKYHLWGFFRSAITDHSLCIPSTHLQQ